MADTGLPPDAGSAKVQATHRPPKAQAREISPKVELAATLAAEFEALHGPPRSPIRTLRDYASEVHAKQGRIAALCLSGGGIRSASFALGVLQSLARHGLLLQFHYLSTVSGGGYIGSWLQAWRKQAGGLDVVMDGLNRRDLETGAEPPELTALREYSAYLTPKRGITSADSWAAVALYVRNLILNWAVLAPAFLALLALPWLAYDLVAAVAERGGPWMFWPWAALGSLALVAGLHSAAWQRRFARPSGSGQPQFLAFVLLPILTAASLLTLAGVSGCAVPLHFAALWGAVVYLLAWGSAWVRAGQNLATLGVHPTPSNPVPPWLEVALWVGCGAFAGVLVALAFGRGYSRDLRETVVVTVASFMLAILAAEILYVGLASYANTGDDDREWLARAAGWLFASAVAWMALAAVVLYAGAIAGLYVALGALAASVLSGTATAGMGSSVKTAATLALNATPRLVPTRVSWLLSVGALVFIATLAVVLSVLNTRVLAWVSPRSADFSSLPAHPLLDAGADLVFIIALVLFAAGASFVINVNRFSLHGVYRNRLIRAFLGAARQQRYGNRRARNPQPFTGFDQNDNVPLANLWEVPWPETERRLFPVLNIALNLVGGSNLAWQERKAESFTATPLHCGNPRTGFRCTAQYGGMKNGLSLGTAMAISGAAISPNMGYHSSPLVGFVMTLFNVRLGWWLGNPNAADRTVRRDGPYFGIGAVLRELFGLTTDDGKYVYLSDGGHFENLGLYEMVRRRCRFILITDAGQDPRSHFEDLGNAVRKIWIDFGVRIEFDALRIEARATPPRPGVDCAIARIRYPEAGARQGLLVYVKPGFHGRESPDIRSYANLHPEFPHESTANQWFTESQMEAYRALGAETMDLICRGCRQRGSKMETSAQLSFGQFMNSVRIYVRSMGQPEPLNVTNAVTLTGSPGRI
jgi:hypothetical protein